MTTFAPPEEDELVDLAPPVEDFTPPEDDSLVDSAYPDLQPESAAASAARNFKAKILPAIGTALGGAGAGLLATPETVGIATIPAAIAGGAVGGAAGEKTYEYLMGEEAAKRERAQIALNEQAHPWASTAGGAIPTLLSLVGGGGLIKTLGSKAAQGLEGAAAQEAIKKATSGLGTKIAEASLTGARLGASETAQRAVQGDDVGVADFADSMARDAVAFGPFGLLPHFDELGKAVGMAIPQAYLSTLAGAAYDSMVHGKPFDAKDIAGKGTAEVVPFALFNAIAHGVQAGQKRLVTTRAQNTATTAADSAQAAGMPQTAQVLRDLAAKAVTTPVAPTQAEPATPPKKISAPGMISLAAKRANELESRIMELEDDGTGGGMVPDGKGGFKPDDTIKATKVLNWKEREELEASKKELEALKGHLGADNAEGIAKDYGYEIGPAGSGAVEQPTQEAPPEIDDSENAMRQRAYAEALNGIPKEQADQLEAATAKIHAKQPLTDVEKRQMKLLSDWIERHVAAQKAGAAPVVEELPAELPPLPPPAEAAIEEALPDAERLSEVVSGAEPPAVEEPPVVDEPPPAPPEIPADLTGQTTGQILPHIEGETTGQEPAEIIEPPPPVEPPQPPISPEVLRGTLSPEPSAEEPTADPFSAPEAETPPPPEVAAIEPPVGSPSEIETQTIPREPATPDGTVAQPVEAAAVNPFGGGERAPDLERAREAATRPNAPETASRARELKDELGGAAQDYTAFSDADMQERAKDIADAVGSVDQMARLLSSEDGVRSLGVDPALQEFVASETLKRAHAAVESATNDVDRIRAVQTLRKVRAVWDVTGTGGGQQMAARRLAGEQLRDVAPAMTVDEAIEKQHRATIDKALPVEPVKQVIERTAEDAGTRAANDLAVKIEAEERGVIPDAPADQAAKIAVLQSQIDAYFEGDTPKRVRVIYDPKGESEAQLNKGVVEVNAAAVGDVSTADITRMLEHEIGHELFNDPEMRDKFNTLWKSLDPLDRAAIESEVAERYSAQERNEEASVRALDAIRAATRNRGQQSAWQKFKAAVERLWMRFTGSMPKDPAALAERMIEVGVQRLRADKVGRGLSMSKRTDLLETDSPALAKLLNTLRSKIKVGMKWKDVFTALPSQQRQWEMEVHDRIRSHEALQDLSPEEAVQLTRELSKAWQRERRTVFNRELEKQLPKLDGVKPETAEKVKASAPRLLQLINLGALDSAAFRDAVAQEWGIANLSSPEAKRVKDLGTRAQQAPEGVPRRKLEQEFVDGLQDLTKLSKLEILENWWTASVLSGWRTHADILLGAANGIEDVGLGAIVTAFRTGNPDVAYRAIGKVIANLPAAIQEALHHIVTGDRSMMRNYDTEVQAALQDGHKMMGNAGRELLKKGGLYKAPGAFMEIVGRMLTAWDHINSSSTFEGAKMMALARHPELYEQALLIGPRERDNARAQARSELTGGAEPNTHAERLQENARVKEILDKEIPTEVIAEASEIGRDAALQGEPTGLGHAVWELSRQIGRIPDKGAEAIEKSGADNTAARLVLAALRRASTISRVLTGSKFVRTAGHALNRQISYVPGVGLLRFAEGRMQGAKADILLAKQLLGTAVGLSLLAAFRHRKDDKEGVEGSWKGLTSQQRSQLYSEGKQPNTVWYRDAKGRVVSFNFNQWGIAGILGTIGAMEDQRRYKGNKSDASILVNGVVTGSMQFTEKAQLQGLQQIFGDSAHSTSGNVTDGLAKRLNRYAATTVGGLVPRIAKDVDAIVAPELHDASQWYEQWAAQVPMVRELSSGKRVDILGKDITIDRGPLSRVVQEGTSDGAYRLLGRMNERDLWLPDPSTGVRVVKMPNGERREMALSEKDRYQRATGAGYRTFLLAHGAEILAMPQDEAKKYISRHTKIIRDQAEEQATGH